MSITVSVARAVMIAALAVGLVFGSLGRGAWEEFESSRAVTRAVEHPEWVAAEVVALSFSDEALGEAAKAYATEEVSPEELRARIMHNNAARVLAGRAPYPVDERLVHAIGHRAGFHAELDVHRGLFLLQQDGRGIGLLQRRFLEVNALDLEDGVLVFCHGGVSKDSGKKKQTRRGSKSLRRALPWIMSARQGGLRDSGLQHRHEATTPIERVQVVATAHMRVSDEDLRHAGAPGQLGHLRAQFGFAVHEHFFQIGHPPPVEQGPGPAAVGAVSAGEHLDLGHAKSCQTR